VSTLGSNIIIANVPTFVRILADAPFDLLLVLNRFHNLSGDNH
jgi:hypothetical protein